METPETATPVAPVASTDATKSVVTSTVKAKSSDGYGYKAYKRKKKDGDVYKKEKMTNKEKITEVLHYMTMLIMIGALGIWSYCIIAESEHMSQSKHTTVIDRPATTITGKKFVIVSNNEYCNYIIEEVMERGFTAATAGRVMFMCMYATTPHLISPHAEQMYITIDENGTVTDSIVNKQDRPDVFLDNIPDMSRSFQNKGRYSIGLSDNVLFQRHLYEMGNDNSNSAAAMDILMLRTKNFKEIPINHDLHVTLRKYKFEIHPLKCPQYFTSWGTTRINGEYMDQSYLMRYILGNHVKSCYEGNVTYCRNLQKAFYDSMKPIYEIQRRANYGNPFDVLNEAVLLKNTASTRTAVKHTFFIIDGIKILLPNVAGAEFEIEEKNEKLKKAMEDHLSGEKDLLHLPNTLMDIINGTSHGYDETAMTGFIIIDSQRRISIGAGGLNEPGGSRICHQGMLLDNNNRLNPTFEQSYKYRHRFLPVLILDPETNKINKVTLILSRNHNNAVQTIANFIYKAVENKRVPGKRKSKSKSQQVPTREANRTSANQTVTPIANVTVVNPSPELKDETHENETDGFGNVLRIPILVSAEGRTIYFIKGLPYSHVRQYQLLEPNITFLEADWDQFKMDILGVSLGKSLLRGYYIDHDGEFAAMAAQ